MDDFFEEERRPRLGLASEHVLAKIKKEEDAKILRDLELAKHEIFCGDYKRYDEIDATIEHCHNIDKFYFIVQVLDRFQISLLKTATKVRYHTGALMYQARPYTSDIGHIKLYQNLKNKRMYRCEIKDMYTIAFEGILKLRADIVLIDFGTHLNNVLFEQLYDLPQYIGYFKDFPAGAKLARVHLGDPVPLGFKDQEINEYFCNKIESYPSKNLKVKILEYRDGIYHVDLLNDKGCSMIDHLSKKFEDKIKCFNYLDHGVRRNDPKAPLDFIQPVVCMNGHQMNSKSHKANFNDQPKQKKKYHSVIHYFKQKEKAIRHDGDHTKSYLHKRFYQVKILCWCDPESFCLIPNDPDYTQNHGEYQRQLDKYQDKLDTNNKNPNQKNFVMGQRCLFRNEFDQNLGKWLRGIVIGVPKLTKAGVLKRNTRIDGVPQGEAIAEHLSAKEEKDEDEDEYLDIDNFVYRIRSIDYGFQCIRSILNLRQVEDEIIFTKKGPWSLRCRLFGIDPFSQDQDENGNRRFSDACLNMIDSWMRERILDNGKYAYFHVLFRTDILKLSEGSLINGPLADITLFHRFEPPYRIEHSLLPRKRRSRYDCLNEYLIDRGFAGDFIHKLGKSSQVELDHFLVNLLVTHDRIS